MRKCRIPENLLSRGQELAASVDRSKTTFMPVKAGQFSLHHTHLVHNSRPNRSTDRRIGLGISYIPTSAHCTSATRGQRHAGARRGRYGNFDDERRPAQDAGPEERAFHAEAVDRFRKMNTEQTPTTKLRSSRGRNAHDQAAVSRPVTPIRRSPERKDYSWPEGRRLVVYLAPQHRALRVWRR